MILLCTPSEARNLKVFIGSEQRQAAQDPMIRRPQRELRRKPSRTCDLCKGRKVIERGPLHEGDAGEYIDCPKCTPPAEE